MKSEGRDMSKSTKAAKSAVFIIIFSALSKPLGFVREMLIGAKFGSGSETDTFFIALSAISLFITIITKSINTTMIPVLSEVETAEGKTGKTSHTNNLFNIVSLISILIISLAWVSAPIIIRIIAPGFGGEQFELGVLLMRIGLPTVFLAGAQGVFRGYLQSELMFSESALAGLPFNFTYIFFLCEQHQINTMQRFIWRLCISLLRRAYRFYSSVTTLTSYYFKFFCSSGMPNIECSSRQNLPKRLVHW